MKCRIGELCDVIGSGGTPSRKNDTFYKGNIKWLKTKELNDGCIYDTEEHITDEAIKKSSAKLFPKDTITVAMYGATVGKLGILKDEMATNQACCNMVVNKNKCDYRFLYYSLLVNRNELINLANGAAQQNLSKGIIENFEIYYYPMEIQERIANILYSLDSKIELNNEMNKTLEEMAQTLFKRWFVDFEFPDKYGKPYKSSGGEMIESELGMIPKGWKAGVLADLVDIKYGKDHKKLEEGSIPVFGSGGIMRYVNKSLYEKESVLIPRKGTLNNVIYVNQPFWSVDTMFFTEMKLPNIAKFIYQFVKSKDLAMMNIGSAVPSMTTSILNSMEIVIPDENILKKFDQIVTAFYTKIEFKNSNSSNLAKLRDFLLPKLMNGEIKVKDIEANL